MRNTENEDILSVLKLEDWLDFRVIVVVVVSRAPGRQGKIEMKGERPCKSQEEIKVGSRSTTAEQVEVWQTASQH